MAIDPSKFHPVNVADTCSVWNVLSSKMLFNAAREARCDFCITSFVRYECLVKPRKSTTVAEQELMDRLRAAQRRGAFQHHSCGIEDLQSISVLESRKCLGKGELSSIAFAMKIRQAVITDDMKAHKLAVEAGHALTQTTPHLCRACQAIARGTSTAPPARCHPGTDASTTIEGGPQRWQ